MRITDDPAAEGKHFTSPRIEECDITDEITDITVSDRTEFYNVAFNDAHVHDVNGIMIFTDCNFDGLTIESMTGAKSLVLLKRCTIKGLCINGDYKGQIMIIDCRLFGMSNLSNMKCRKLVIRGTNCEYVKATKVQIDRVILRLSRFVQLFDLNDSIVNYIDLRETIILETFRVPDIPMNKGMVMRIDDITINGRMILDLPGGSRPQKEFVNQLSANNGSSGMSALRSILESNRRFYAADLAFIEQKKKELDRDDFDSSFSNRAITAISYHYSRNGMSPIVTLGWMAVTIILFGIIYQILGISSIYHDSGSVFVDSMYLSIVSFFISDIITINDLGLWVCVAESIIGFFMMLHFTVILTRKMIR